MYFVSESVSEGHPDKICDLISDKILDAFLIADPLSKVACECLITHKKLIIAGEVSSKGKVNFKQLVDEVFADIGLLDEPVIGDFSYHDLEVEVVVSKQSSEINEKVTHSKALFHELGAGDQGIVYGYACRQTDNYLPLISTLCNDFMYAAAKLRKARELPYALSDMKCQVSSCYDKVILLRQPQQCFKLDAVTFSIQHTSDLVISELEDAVYKLIVLPSVEKYHLNHDFSFHVNESGPFIIGGAAADTGLTGRKLNVDTYGGWVAIGGGALSGKDSTKIDRSGCYLARYIAKNLVAADFCDECLVQLAYLIGNPNPIAVNIDTYGTEKIPYECLVKIVLQVAPLSLSSIIATLDLLKPCYYNTARYGHFNDEKSSWEQLDLAKIFKLAYKK